MNPERSNPVLIELESPIDKEHGRRHRWRATDGAVLITILVIVAIAATLALSISRGLERSAFTREHILLLRMTDNSPQRMAYRIGLMLLAMLCTLGAIAMRRPAAQSPALCKALRATSKFLRKWCGMFLVAGTALVPLFDLRGTVFPGPEGRGLRLSFWLGSLGLMPLLLFWIRSRKRSVGAIVIWSCVVAYGCFLVVPGLVRVPFLSEPLLTWAEWHYSVTLAQADRLAAGLRLGSQVNLNYGLIHALALGVFERSAGVLNFGQHLRLVQASQIVFLAVAFLAFRLWKPANPMFALVGMLLIGPWLSTSHLAVYYPNQSGWRSLGLAAGVAIMLVCRKPLSRTALLLGAAAGFLMLYNPETGACLSFGYVLFLLSRRRGLTLKQASGLALRAGVGALLTFLIVAGSYRAGLGAWPPFTAGSLFGFITKFGGGYGGLPLYFDPFAILICVHSAYLVGSLALSWRVRDLMFEESVKLGISGTILVWFSYYVNRPHAWNLWTFQFLYLFLVADLFEARILRRLSRRGLSAIFDRRLAALTFVITPMVFSSNYSILLATLPAGESVIKSVVVSGVAMPQTSAGTLRLQADFLANQPSDTLYFSRHSYSLALLSRRFNPLFVQDAFAETITNADFERLLAEIEKRSPRVLLFDAQENLPLLAENPAIGYYMFFFNRIESRLSDRYDRATVTGGWQVWRLRLPAQNAGILSTNGFGER